MVTKRSLVKQVATISVPFLLGLIVGRQLITGLDLISALLAVIGYVAILIWGTKLVRRLWKVSKEKK